jgi:hypothetical protein
MSVNPTFGVNDYEKSKTQTERQTIVHDILMILYGKPGFFPSIPSLGMNVKEYLYRAEDEIDTGEIKNLLRTQCSDFGTYIDDDSLDVEKTTYNGQTVLLFILPTINDTGEKIAVLGVTLNSKREVVYNFTENITQKL